MDLSFWETIKDSADPKMYQAYLAEFPKGTFAAIARIKLEALSKPSKTTETKKQIKALEEKAAALEAEEQRLAKQREALQKQAEAQKLAKLTPPERTEPPSFTVEALDEVFITLKTVNIRERPTATSRKVSRLQRGTEVDVTGKTRFEGKDWYRVAHAGSSAYVFGSLLREKHKVLQEQQEEQERKAAALEEEVAKQNRLEQEQAEKARLEEEQKKLFEQQATAPKEEEEEIQTASITPNQSASEDASLYHLWAGKTFMLDDNPFFLTMVTSKDGKRYKAEWTYGIGGQSARVELIN